MINLTGRLALAVLPILLFAFVVSAQDLDDVTLTGRVTDSNGLAIVGAAVKATLVNTGSERSVMTNDEGRFRLIELKPGLYKVTVSQNGFGTKERTDLQTVSGQNLQVDFQLLPADVKADTTVTVTEEDAPAVDVTRTIVGGTITEREIEEIPTNSRNPLDLVLTLGGTSEEQLSTSGLSEDRNQNSATAPLEQGNFSLSGGTAYSNNLTIDGLDNNDDRSSRDRFQPSLESIAEVQVITNQFSAEYGRASGGRVNLRTRAGGNKFRGRVFMFFRDDNLNANSFYNNTRKYTPIFPLQLPDTNPLFNRLPLTEYNPGFTFSGPVMLPSLYDGHNRTFFSAAYEYNNLKDTTSINTYVPVGSNPRYSLPAGNTPCPPTVPCFDGNSSSTTAILGYTATFATPSVNHIFTARVDHKLTKNNDFTFGWQLGRKNNRRTSGASTTRLDDALQARNSDTDAFNFTDNHVFGANTVNQFRMQYSVFKPSFETLNPLDPVVLIGYRNPETGSSQTLIAGNSTAAILGDATAFPQNRTETRYQFQDSLTYLAGRHTFKGGFDVQNVNSKADALGDATGTFSFANILDYQNNKTSRYLQNFGTRSDVINTYWGVFINDEMKAFSNLTLSYGVRYERETAVADNNNFGPRLGIAWDPFKKGKGVIRFGAGVFYNRALLRTVADSIQNTGGDFVAFSTNNIGAGATDSRRTAILTAIAARFPNTYASISDLKAVVLAGCAAATAPLGPCNANTGFARNVSTNGNPLRSVDADLKIPESYQFNIGFEREIFKGWVFEANYTWNKTVHLWRDSNPNAPSLGLANSLLHKNYKDWTEYLRENPFSITNQNGTTRTYNFTLGSTTDGTGVVGTTGTSMNVCSFTLTNTCTVNLNSISTSATAPSATVVGANGNSTGGPIGIALAAIAQFRPDNSVAETSRIGSRGNAFYHGLILELRSRYSKLGNGFGANFRMAYTLSSTKDDGLNNTSNAEVDGDFSREWARNLQDRRHRLAFSGTFDTPWWFGKLKFSPLFRFGTSAPFNLGNGGSDRNLDDLSTDRLNFSGNVNDIRWREPGSPVPTALIAQFSLQPIGAKSGNLPRNSGTGPSFYTFDLNVTREWKITERTKLRPVIQFDNIFNASVFNYGAGFIDFQALRNDGTAPTAAQTLARDNFLVPTRTYRQRQIRLGVRFDF